MTKERFANIWLTGEGIVLLLVLWGTIIYAVGCRLGNNWEPPTDEVIYLAVIVGTSVFNFFAYTLLRPLIYWILYG